MLKYLTLSIALLLTLLLAQAQAGSSAGVAPTLPADQIAAFAEQIEADLQARGVEVAIVARQGRDPASLPAGVRYTHVAYWVARRNRPGFDVYNLYQRANDLTRSDLVQDSPRDFITPVHRLEVGIAIPAPRLQRKLRAVIESPTYAALHRPDYAVLANPMTLTFQNCTEHTLDVLMAALYGTGDVTRIKANIAAHFTPQPIPLSGLKRALAPAASQALTTRDHGADVRTTTFGSLARFLQDFDLASDVYRLTPQARGSL